MRGIKNSLKMRRPLGSEAKTVQTYLFFSASISFRWTDCGRVTPGYTIASCQYFTKMKNYEVL
jgi:hypothetical protein